MEYELLTDDVDLLPSDFKFHDLYHGLLLFFGNRPTSDTKLAIHEDLKNTPIQYYNIERLIRYNHGWSIHDCFWIEQDDDISCWKGSPLEGIGVAPNTDWSNIFMYFKFKTFQMTN